MAKVNEFDVLFGNVPDVAEAPPVAKQRATSTANQAAPVTLELDPPVAPRIAEPDAPEPDKNEFESFFPPEGNTLPAGDTLSPKAVAAIAAGAGAAYSAIKTKPGIDNIISRKVERLYGLPKGSLAEMQGLREPALPPTVGQAAKAVAARYSGPFEVGTETPNRLPAGSTGTMPYNYAKAAGLSDIEAGLAKDMTKNPGGTHDLTTKRRVALERLMGTDPTFKENHNYSGLMLDTSVGSGPRGATRVPVPSVQPPATAPLADMQKNIERANTVSHGAQRGLAAVRGGVGSGLTALQAYGMAGDMAQGKTPDWQDWLSLVGGPAATFGGKILGPLGAAAQIPYAIRHREEIARGMTMGDINPFIFNGSEGATPAFPDLIDPRSAYPGQGRTQ